MKRSDPIPVRCALPDGAIFAAPADNISRQGFDFYIVESPTLLTVGDSFRLTFETPLEDVAGTAAIRSISKTCDMVRFGVEFTEVFNDGQTKLEQHQIFRERQVAEGGDEKWVRRKPLVFVVDEPRAREHYSFLNDAFEVAYSDQFGLIGRLLAAPPDAILFSTGLPDSRMTLQVLMSHPVLKGIPVIEVQKKQRKNPGNFFSSLSFPMDKDRALETLHQAVSALAISRMLREGEFSGPFKTGVNILLVDDASASETYDLETLRSLGCDIKLIIDLKLLYDSFVWSTPDVIVIDENTKEIDAHTICRLLNMNRELKDVPKVLLSQGKGRRHSGRSGLFSSVLTKPLTARQLLSNIHYLLAQMSR